jgi:hypothetical protein
MRHNGNADLNPQRAQLRITIEQIENAVTHISEYQIVFLTRRKEPFARSRFYKRRENAVDAAMNFIEKMQLSKFLKEF